MRIYNKLKGVVGVVAVIIDLLDENNYLRLNVEKLKFKVEVSSRHVHLSQEDVDILFGQKGYVLTPHKELYQPGYYVCKEKVSIQKGDKKIERISILGPTRARSIVEVSRTDCYHLKAQAFVRQSDDLEGTESITIIGPAGSVELKNGLIVAQRHIHMTPQDAIDLKVVDRQVVNVAIESSCRKLIFGDVIVRIDPRLIIAMHIDTDEANAALISSDGCEGYLIQVEDF